MRAPETTIERSLPDAVTGSRATGWWGMALFIATEATLFATLISSYLYIRANTATWPPGGIAAPELRLPIVGTLILLGSSAPMAWADAGIGRGDQRRARIGLALAFVLGAIFLGIQGMEYARAGFRPWTNVYGSLFFTITGFHGLHLLVGLIMNAVVQVRAWLGHFDATRRLAVQNATLYWHFVDAVWIFIFAALYLLPHLT